MRILGVAVLAELAFSVSDLAQVRFAVSPMWEVGPSFRLLHSGSAYPVHRPWAEQVRARLAAAGLDRGWLAELIPPSGYVPDFLNPAPAGPAPTLAEELAKIRAAPSIRIRQDLDRLRHEQGRLGPRARTLYAEPQARLVRVAEEIETYWELALAPYWARIRAVLDADIFYRARQVAEHGTSHLFNDLHPSVSWDDNALRLARRPRPLSRKTAGAGLLLIPSAFTGPGPFTRVTPPEPPQLAYPARGTGSLWGPRPITGTDALAAVLGRSRTLLLTELETPASTTELAHRTGLSAAGVSQCLTALRDAGLVSAHRAGRSVLYARTSVAESVLAASP
ncbi:ArsR/SmtB family transcription factor [Streptomyces lunaelactis]|uniref:ArsR/SmtB family transcription factor n=1 Tax=Streptomyces lunaelactis TaxID=1535768 RepID=UPI0015855996|nr:winged helix-turn-helix domain-containing protein [Streptomyces lunaelactis]NUK04345.1 winged helix-turn-helix transcriptional regulator [Streptomyces lunaelactis]NUK18798.1 winged helix-turn-helix transcriptional regulator [Streptomyces lunaelactis]